MLGGLKCGLLPYPCGLMSSWAFGLWDSILWAFVLHSRPAADTGFAPGVPMGAEPPPARSTDRAPGGSQGGR